MHVAGSIHADATSAAPVWLEKPHDANALVDGLWSGTAVRDAEGEMHLGGLPVSRIIEQTGSPVYVIDELDFRGRALTWAQAFEGWKVYYAGKSFLSGVIARWVQQEGLNLDVCSYGELTVALRAGFDPARIGLHGNNKSEDLLRLALTAGVGRIIVDSADEIARLERIGAELDVRPDVLIRVTTGVEAHTHEYIATAHEDQKFGLSLTSGAAREAVLAVQRRPELRLLGIHSHIGSQIFSTSGFEVAAHRVVGFVAGLQTQDGIAVEELNLGGGMGIAYLPSDDPVAPVGMAEALRSIVTAECTRQGIAVPRIAVEPGRAIVGPAMVTVYRVGTVKPVEYRTGAWRTYVSVDGGMSDNIRTALYEAEYTVVLANRSSSAPAMLSRVVGKHCESGDIVVRDVWLPADLARGDLIAVASTGAYCRSMASNYNQLTRPPVLSVRGGSQRTVLRRETLADLFALDPLLAGEPAGELAAETTA